MRARDPPRTGLPTVLRAAVLFSFPIPTVGTEREPARPSLIAIAHRTLDGGPPFGRLKNTRVHQNTTAAESVPGQVGYDRPTVKPVSIIKNRSASDPDAFPYRLIYQRACRSRKQGFRGLTSSGSLFFSPLFFYFLGRD